MYTLGPEMNDLIQLALNIIISVILIYNLHLFWEYLKDTYSIRKHKNVVDIQMNKYKQMMSEFVQASPTKSTLSETDLREMNDELVAFMEQQSGPTPNSI
jgi:hypothetical protein